VEREAARMTSWTLPYLEVHSFVFPVVFCLAFSFAIPRRFTNTCPSQGIKRSRLSAKTGHEVFNQNKKPLQQQHGVADLVRVHF
jgi:hypothetical protein